LAKYIFENNINNSSNIITTRKMSTLDCLVLKLEDDSMCLYLIYDLLRERYGIWGKAIQNNKDSDSENDNEYQGFYYNCNYKNIKHLFSFISFILDSSISVTLYNFSDLPNGCSEITFELLEELSLDENIITCYDNVVYDEEYIVNTLKMLSFIRNEYV
jgi:hypothetical protein